MNKCKVCGNPCLKKFCSVKCKNKARCFVGSVYVKSRPKYYDKKEIVLVESTCPKCRCKHKAETKWNYCPECKKNIDRTPDQLSEEFKISSRL